MRNNLIKELKTLAELILREETAPSDKATLDQARSLYEKLLIIQHVQNESERAEPLHEEENESTQMNFEPEIEEAEVNEIATPDHEDSVKVVEENEEPMNLSDLFVPTFDGIKEDMSQKAEFKDTISLDETENMFQTKKDEPRQLSLNDKLVGSSIQIGLNDRIAFVNKLFNFSQSDFNKALTKLNDCNSKEEALKYFQYQVKPNYNWKGKEDLEDRLIGLIERKFL